MTTTENPEIIKLKELDVDIIPPRTADHKNPDKGGSKIVCIGKPGTGKCLAPKTPILMFDGSIKYVENVLIGDLLMGDDSTPRTVLSVCKGEEQMYKVFQENGENYTVNLPHILSLKNKNGNVKDLSIIELLSNSDIMSNYKGYKVAVDFPLKRVEIDPYFLGFWLSYKFEEEECFRFFNNLNPLYNIEEFENYLTRLNLKNNKHIPFIYKINDRETRLKLFSGLASNFVNSENSQYYETENELLIDDIIFTSRSLGFRVNKIKNNNIFQCHIYGNFLDKMRKSTLQENKSEDLLTDIEVKQVGKGEYYGFQLDGNNRFLLGDFTVTHNTTLIASLLYAKKHIFPVAMAMSGTEDSNHFYRSILPTTFVFNNYDEGQIEKFIKRQKIAKEHLENPWAVMILDDCTDDPALFRKPLQNGLYKRGRHWKMWYILSLQYGMDVRPVIRTNIDGVFILREPNMRNRRVMYENYASIIPDFKLFCDILDQITNDYTALYIHNTTEKNDWKDCVFWYKAKQIPPDFKFGSDDYWQYHFSRYNEEYIDPITI